MLLLVYSGDAASSSNVGYGWNPSDVHGWAPRHVPPDREHGATARLDTLLKTRT